MIALPLILVIAATGGLFALAGRACRLRASFDAMASERRAAIRQLAQLRGDNAAQLRTIRVLRRALLRMGERP